MRVGMPLEMRIPLKRYLSAINNLLHYKALIIIQNKCRVNAITVKMPALVEVNYEDLFIFFEPLG